MPLKVRDEDKLITVTWFPITEVLQWKSCDNGCVRYNEDTDQPILVRVLNQKRKDEQYCDAYDFLKANGFTEPLVCEREGYHGDGHHRLAAAIDLNYQTIPYVQIPDTFISDIGEWEFEGTLLHEANPLPDCVLTV